MTLHAPRIVLAGLSGDSGKTLVSLGLLLAARERGLPVAAFKKGPDYIDAMWLSWASGRPARHLDTFLMGADTAARAFAAHASPEGLNLIEGNRGLFDGVDAAGTHSTAELAKRLRAPVLLVVNATKATRTVAALVRGCQVVDPRVRLAGVVLNQVAGERHERVIREAIEDLCGVPVVGAVARISGGGPLPGRHLGLVPPEECDASGRLAAELATIVRASVDLDAVLGLADTAEPLEAPGAAADTRPGTHPAGGNEADSGSRPGVRADSALDGADADRAPGTPGGRHADGTGLAIGVVRDSAFSFYYPENLEALEETGARLVYVSSLTDHELPPDLDALYIGGGFPQTHGTRIAANRPFLAALAAAADRGLPIYAECGGLMLLTRAIRWKGERVPMAGVLPFEVEVHPRPRGHGYSRLVVDRPNAFFAEGTVIDGHQFHYSWPEPSADDAPATACAVERGTGAFGGRDAVVAGRVWASYTHVHARATPAWADAMVRAAREARAAVQARPTRGAAGRDDRGSE